MSSHIVTSDSEFPSEGPRAAVCRIIRPSDSKLLCVWNKRYGRWGWPGGKVEAGETPRQAAARECFEEAGVSPDHMTPLYGGLHGESIESTRGSHVCVFDATFSLRELEDAREIEAGCPVTFFTSEEFLRWCIAPDFYHDMYRALAEAGRR
jgi:8-oxo-dGTP pyrophosphatase MutT (NUDIX family)